MRFRGAFPDMKAVTAQAYDDVQHAVTAAMDEVTAGLKQELRDQIEAAGMGSRLAKTWQGKRFPDFKPSINAAAYVWSRAPDIVDAFERGVPIVAKNRKYLAIPTKDAGVLHTTVKGKRLTPAIWETETGVKLRFVPRGNHALLVSDGRYVRQPARYRRRKSFKPAKYPALPGQKRSIVIFVLVPQVSPGKRLDIEGVGNRWADRVGDLIAANWRS
jgi:hypothetical protein